MRKRDEGTEPEAQHCPNLTSQLIVFSVGYQLKMTEKVNDVAYEISSQLSGKPCTSMLIRWPQDKRAETVRRCIVPQPAEH